MTRRAVAIIPPPEDEEALMAWDLDLYVEKRTAGGAWEPIEAPGEPDDSGLPRSWSERSGCEREAMHALARLGDVDGIGLAHAMADAPRGRPDGLSLELQLVSRRFERLAARSREEVFFSWVTLAEVDTFDFHQSTKMLCV